MSSGSRDSIVLLARNYQLQGLVRRPLHGTKSLTREQSEFDHDSTGHSKIILAVNVDGPDDGLHSGRPNTVNDSAALGRILSDEDIQTLGGALSGKVCIRRNCTKQPIDIFYWRKPGAASI